MASEPGELPVIRPLLNCHHRKNEPAAVRFLFLDSRLVYVIINPAFIKKPAREAGSHFRRILTRLARLGRRPELIHRLFLPEGSRVGL